MSFLAFWDAVAKIMAQNSSFLSSIDSGQNNKATGVTEGEIRSYLNAVPVLNAMSASELFHLVVVMLSCRPDPCAQVDLSVYCK